MIILASASPRRKELLALIVEEYRVIPSNADETSNFKNARELVRFLAQKKAQNVAERYPKDTVIGADTVVEAAGEILGKPKDRADAERMIRLLSGRTHTVYTGLCVVNGAYIDADACATQVTFSAMTEEEIQVYIDTEDVMDKAGAYAIQGGAAKFVQKIDGCFFNVVGLPVSMLYRMLCRTEKICAKSKCPEVR